MHKVFFESTFRWKLFLTQFFCSLYIYKDLNWGTFISRPMFEYVTEGNKQIDNDQHILWQIKSSSYGHASSKSQSNYYKEYVFIISTLLYRFQIG